MYLTSLFKHTRTSQVWLTSTTVKRTLSGLTLGIQLGELQPHRPLQAYLGWLPPRMPRRRLQSQGRWCLAPSVWAAGGSDLPEFKCCSRQSPPTRRQSDVSGGFCHCPAHLLLHFPLWFCGLKKKGRKGNTHKTLLMNNVINYPFHL